MKTFSERISVTKIKKSHIVSLIETKLSHNVKVDIPGYYIFKKSKDALSRGIIIAVDKEISSKCIETIQIENN